VKKPILVLLGLLLLASTSAHAWWNKDWKQREQVKLDTSAQGVETKSVLNDAVVAVRLHLGNFTFTDAKPDGSDLRFVAADDKTELKHFVERFDAGNGIAVVWVRVPMLAVGNAAQAVWLYHGNPQAPAATPDAEKAVHDSGSVVFNFSETDGIVRDAASGIATTAKPAGIEQAGLLGSSAVFQGSAMVLPDAAPLQRAAGGSLSVSFWLRPTAAVVKAALYQHGNLSLDLDGGVLALRAGSSVVVKGGQVKPDAWQHVGLAIGNGRAAIFLDGVEVGGAAMQLPALGGDVRIGEGLLGLIDALQISAANRSADWFKIAVRSQGLDSNFPQVAPEGDGEGGGSHSYFGILISNLTADAWAVIGILAIMFVIAVFVMVDKTRFVGRADKANRAFLRSFRDAGDDFIGIANDPAYAHSALYRLYEAGVRELRKRGAGASIGAAAAPISGASVNAIKAAIDADMVRETHQLNSRMVLLTIAISGGPFLGLLGTVVGVMITFAAIAAAGDVNVNAIAPGIAAALLATVAGLGVAIPALFGYNYLASRIKNISADMHIFVDELVTRIAEQYCAS
jgi:biopolymer transport protein ExbB